MEPLNKVKENSGNSSWLSNTVRREAQEKRRCAQQIQSYRETLSRQQVKQIIGVYQNHEYRAPRSREFVCKEEQIMFDKQSSMNHYSKIIGLEKKSKNPRDHIIKEMGLRIRSLKYIMGQISREIDIEIEKEESKRKPIQNIQPTQTDEDKQQNQEKTEQKQKGQKFLDKQENKGMISKKEQNAKNESKEN